jgi:hypothetical protein
MRACLRGTGVLLLVFAAMPLLAADDDTKKKADAKPAAKAAKDDDTKKPAKTGKKDDDPETKGEKKEKLVWGATFMGKLKEMDANSQKNFTVEVQISMPNPDGIAAMQRAQVGWQQRQFQIQRNPNFVQRAQQLAQLQRDIQTQLPQLQRNTYRQQPKDVPLRAGDKIRVRNLMPPLEYDDKGNIKKYTKQELKELKGTENLPGYNAEYDALRAGQYVTVYLAKGQANPAKGAKGAKGGEKVGGLKLDDDAALGASERPEVVMIVIMAEPKDR